MGDSATGIPGQNVTASGTRYKGVPNPSTSYVVSPVRSPGATATGTSGYGGVTVSYTATLTPVTISLTGTTLDASGNANILVGQGCSANITGLPGGTGWKTVYNWSVSGTTFQSWNGDSGTVPVAAVLGPGVTNQATAHWFWADSQGMKTVTLHRDLNTTCRSRNTVHGDGNKVSKPGGASLDG